MSGNGINNVRVVLWGSTIGYLHRNENGVVAFQYDRDFLNSGIEVAGLTEKNTIRIDNCLTNRLKNDRI